jgi:tRNA(Arg) A34 adenosine deaminase TadA
MLAQTALGGWDLGADGLPVHELVVNWRPCIQCYGATMWSGVRGLVVAGQGAELEEITTFDEGPLGADWAEQFEARGIEVVTDVLRDDALKVFRSYREAVDAEGLVVYNARGGAE